MLCTPVRTMVLLPEYMTDIEPFWGIKLGEWILM